MSKNARRQSAFVEAFEVYQRITPAEILAYIAGRS
jgi:hypothetical protein